MCVVCAGVGVREEVCLVGAGLGEEGEEEEGGGDRQV